MDIEIERRWLVTDYVWEQYATHETDIEQVYLVISPEFTMRIRFEEGREPVLCVKGKTQGLSTPEYETVIDRAYAIAVCTMRSDYALLKIRSRIPYGENTIEVDRFLGKLIGLSIAEVEFQSEAAAVAFEIPRWFGTEITDDHRYKNALLVQHGIPT